MDMDFENGDGLAGLQAKLPAGSSSRATEERLWHFGKPPKWESGDAAHKS